MGLWPYRCETCARRFVAARRYFDNRVAQQETLRQKQPRQEQRRQAEQAGPGMAFRSDPVRPVAKIVIQANDHAQLDKILVALHRAVSSYQQPVSEPANAGTR